MRTMDETMLMAYLDGELDEATCREVEARIANDHVLEAMVRDLREGDALVAAAFNHALFDAPKPAAVAGVATARGRWFSRPWGPVPVALAASLAVLVIGGAAGLAMLDTAVEREFDRRALAQAQDQSAISETRAAMLEKQLSGTEVSWSNPGSDNRGTMMPVQTWRTKSGQYCRDFEESNTIEGVTTVQYGVACRTADGEWKVRVRYFPD